jgi:hypothetical protein
MARLLLYTKDVQAFTGKSERASRELIKKIRSSYNKQADKPLTIVEFCDYMNIPLKLVWEMLK